MKPIVLMFCLIYNEVQHPVTSVNIRETFPYQVLIKLLINLNSYLDFVGGNAFPILYKQSFSGEQARAHMPSCLNKHVVKQRSIYRFLAYLAHLSQRLKVSYCDYWMSIVRRASSAINNNRFKRHLLNYWLDFDQTISYVLLPILVHVLLLNCLYF